MNDELSSFAEFSFSFVDELAYAFTSDEVLGFSVTIMFDEVLGDTVSVTISSESR